MWQIEKKDIKVLFNGIGLYGIVLTWPDSNLLIEMCPRNCIVLPSNGLTGHNLNATLKTKESYQYSADSIMKY